MVQRVEHRSNELGVTNFAHSKVAMHLEKISEFVTFLTNKDHTLQEILNHLSRVVFKSLNVSSVSLLQLNDSNELVVSARSGVSKEAVFTMPLKYSMDDEYPSVDAIRTLGTVCIDTLPNWGDQYPLMKNFPLGEQSKTFLAVPIYLTGTPVAVLKLIANTRLSINIETDAFLKAVGHILSMYIYRNVVSSPEGEESAGSSNKNAAEVVGSDLTDRQLVILRLISEDRTNLSISQFLGYSESTIRQEIMKIFAKLGCSHRQEAAQLFRGYSL